MAYGLWLMAYVMAYGLWLMAYGLWLVTTSPTSVPGAFLRIAGCSGYKLKNDALSAELSIAFSAK
jgi:hypothetical protein